MYILFRCENLRAFIFKGSPPPPPLLFLIAHENFLYQTNKLTSSVTNRYLKQCRLIVNWTIRNKIQWNFNQNTKIFI